MTRIRELRESMGIKQEELALLCHVSQSTISMWEIGKTVPRKKALEKLAERFGVPAGYILGIDDIEDGEVVAPCGLTDDEKVLLDRYRVLSDEDKEVVRYHALRLKREADRGTGADARQTAG